MAQERADFLVRFLRQLASEIDVSFHVLDEILGLHKKVREENTH